VAGKSVIVIWVTLRRSTSVRMPLRNRDAIYRTNQMPQRWKHDHDRQHDQGAARTTVVLHLD
jgi:hypothetical protein